MLKKNYENLIKIIIVFLIYLFSANVFCFLFEGILGSTYATFISDLVVFFIIVLLYKDKIKNSFNKFIQNYSLKTKIWIIVKWFVIIFAINMIGGMITEMIFPDQNMNDENTNILYNLASVSTLYTLFKSLIFSTIAEVLIFHQSIRDILKKNNLLFMLVAAFIYAAMNIAYVNISAVSLIDFVRCFIFSLILSWIYIKNDDNIFLIMLIKFVYALLPVTIMLVSIGA